MGKYKEVREVIHLQAQRNSHQNIAIAVQSPAYLFQSA